MAYQEKEYRNYIKADNLIKFEVIEKETDLLVLADKNLYEKALALVLKYRGELEKYIALNPKFAKSYSPLWTGFKAPLIAKEMAGAARRAKVGPMAAVAGAIAESVGNDLLEYSEEIIIENGGDIFLKINKTRQVAVYAGKSPFSKKIALEIEPREEPFAISASSGTAEHSFSFGRADAVIVIAKKAALADAATTAIGNEVKEVSDIERGLKLARKIRGLDGVLIIKDDQIGARGKVKLVPLK
jgi:ApbE superfamily uncharacterized protein (UPF0280 family)